MARVIYLKMNAFKAQRRFGDRASCLRRYFMAENNNWMIDNNDPARLEIVERAKTLGITGTPDKAAHVLGPITLADGRTVQAHVVHAVDPIISDGDELVMINRVNPPGKGLP